MLKGLAIIAVILLHAFPEGPLYDWAGPLHIGQAVPVFAVVMGLNVLPSIIRAGATRLGEAYTLRYVVSRINRLYLPFLVIFAIGAIAAVVRGDLHAGSIAGLITGELPTSGPGNYFIGFAFQFAVIAPALCLAYRRAPTPTLVVAFALCAVFDLAAPHVALFDSRPYYYAAAVFRFLPYVALGLVLADLMLRDEPVPPWWILAWVVGAAYLVAVVIDPTFGPFGTEDWRRTGQTFISAYYSAGLVVAGLAFLPRRGRATAALSLLGRASYHIFLAQILWFALIDTRSFALLVPDVIACCAIGLAFWAAMERVPPLRLTRR